MNVDMVERIANAVLYEGYMLYPYTATSVKNRQRWNFGVLSPPAYDTCEMQTECLILGDASVNVKVRFLQDTGSATIERCRRIGRRYPGFSEAMPAWTSSQSKAQWTPDCLPCRARLRTPP